jgi:hypothetical protein
MTVSPSTLHLTVHSLTIDPDPSSVKPSVKPFRSISVRWPCKNKNQPRLIFVSSAQGPSSARSRRRLFNHASHLHQSGREKRTATRMEDTPIRRLTPSPTDILLLRLPGQVHPPLRRHLQGLALAPHHHHPALPRRARRRQPVSILARTHTYLDAERHGRAAATASWPASAPRTSRSRSPPPPPPAPRGQLAAPPTLPPRDASHRPGALRSPPRLVPRRAPVQELKDVGFSPPLQPHHHEALRSSPPAPGNPPSPQTTATMPVALDGKLHWPPIWRCCATHGRHKDYTAFGTV